MKETLYLGRLTSTIFMAIVIKIRDNFAYEIHDDFVNDLH